MPMNMGPYLQGLDLSMNLSSGRRITYMIKAGDEAMLHSRSLQVPLREKLTGTEYLKGRDGGIRVAVLWCQRIK